MGGMLYRLLRSGEFTVPTNTAYDKRKHLSAADIAVDSHSNPTMLAITLKYSKTDQFGKGATLYLGHTAGPMCPVTAILQYLAVRPARDGPLFITERGTPLTKKLFVQRVCEAPASTPPTTRATPFISGQLPLQLRVA